MAVNDEQKLELNNVLEQQQYTKRNTVPALEAMLYEPIPVLDHGFIRVVDYMGDDSSIVQAARVSYGKGTKQVSEDRGLIRYLLRHRHTTPFEMCDIKLHIKLPIFIARQWIRHRTASVNEYSARYSILGREFYLPTPENLAAQSQINKQGRDNVLTGDEAMRVMQLLKDDSMQVYDHYEEMLNEDDLGNVRDPSRQGLARELARMNITLNYYTEWYWKINLHNLLHFVSLRADSHAQYEIRVYAEKILDVIKAWVPHTYEAMQDYMIGSTRLSAESLRIVKALIKGEKIERESTKLSKREWRELMEELEIETEMA
jgi:thymidylate synthase (FAD)